MKKNFILYLKIIISGLLLFIVLSKIDIRKLMSVLYESKIQYIILSLIVIFFGIFISTFKWKIINEVITKEKYSWKKLLSYYFIGKFFSSFLPGSVGGDISRVYYLKKKQGIKKSFSSVFLERFTGFYILFSFFLISTFFLNLDLSYLKIIKITCLVLFFIGTLILSLFKWRLKIIDKIASFTKIQFLLDDYRSLVSKRNSLIYVFLLSFMFQILIIIFDLLLIASFSPLKNVSHLISLILIANFLTNIPISFNGLGLKEYFYLITLTPLGYSSEIAFAVGFLSYLLNLVSSLPGLLFYFRIKGSKV